MTRNAAPSLDPFLGNYPRRLKTSS
jgi:hypothetical protein